MQGNAPDEEYDDPHGECAFEMAILRNEIERLTNVLSGSTIRELNALAEAEMFRHALKEIASWPAVNKASDSPSCAENVCESMAAWAAITLNPRPSPQPSE